MFAVRIATKTCVRGERRETYFKVRSLFFFVEEFTCQSGCLIAVARSRRSKMKKIAMLELFRSSLKAFVCPCHLQKEVALVLRVCFCFCIDTCFLLSKKTVFRQYALLASVCNAVHCDVELAECLPL